ncbi:MAG TPA: hypothetical protein VF789_04090 [Thermoanaerobaculia bacterium]
MMKTLLAGLLLCLCALGTPGPSLAQDGRDAGDDPIQKLQREGWTIVQDGVLRRQSNPGEIETFVYGVEGFTWKLQDLRAQLRKLRAEMQAAPTPDLRRAVASHRKVIASTREMIERARAAEADGETATLKVLSCSPTFNYDAEAAHKTDRQGTWADASAEYHMPAECYGTGEVYAYAFAKTTVNGAPTTATVTDGPRSGADVSAAADANRNGGPLCESYAYASVTGYGLNLSSYSKAKSNESCAWPAPPYVSVKSDKSPELWLDEEECVTITWTVNISGGVPGYTSRIYRNNVFLKNGTSYSENVCNNNDGTYEWAGADITIRADVTDSAAQSTSASQRTNVIFIHWRP